MKTFFQFQKDLFRVLPCNRIVAGFLVLVIVSLQPCQLRAQQESASNRAGSTRKEDDLALIHARVALSRYPEIKPKNLFIKVKDGVAILGGEVSSQSQAEQVVRVVKQISGIFDVKNRLTIQVVKEPLIVLPGKEEAPVRTESGSFDPQTGKLGTLAGRTPGPLSPAITREQAGQKPSANSVKRSPLPANPYPPARVEEKEENQKASRPVGGAVSLGLPQPDQDFMPDLQNAINQARSEDNRFRGLRVSIRNETTLVVSDIADRTEDLTRFIFRLRKIPGIKTITLQEEE